jgi:hypothetical protein
LEMVGCLSQGMKEWFYVLGDRMLLCLAWNYGHQWLWSL